MPPWINIENSQDKKPNMLARKWFNYRGGVKK
jgi:hypothetical protein